MNLKEFVTPPKQYRPSPFWSWNDVMEPAEVETRIREMKKKGFGGFFIHSRTGLRTKYMGEEWMRVIRRAVETARDMKIECWLYDEDKWPSGFGGGATTEDKDENLAMALTWIENASSLDENTVENVLAYTRKDSDGKIELLLDKPEVLTDIGAFIERRFTRGHFWFNGENYIDLLNPETVNDFIENTYEKYAKLFRYDFGEYLPGIFTDEPNINRNIKWFDQDDKTTFSFPWSPGFAEFFEKLHGYSPHEHLHHLLNTADDGFKFRHDYWKAINERFIEAFTIPISSWCKEHELLMTGHYLYEDDFSPMISSGGAVMPHYEYMDVPGIDHLGRNIRDPWTVKQVTSVANQMGKKRIICEIFGTAGQSLSFEEMKWIADFHFALGITFLNPHLTLFSLKGDRKRDFPPTFSYHQPYWEHFRVINDYLSRSSWAVSQGRSTASVLALVPMTSAYGVYDISSENGGEKLSSIEKSYHALVEELLAEHISYDLGDERVLSRYGETQDTLLTIGQAEYTAVILPASLTWQSSTLDVLESFNGMVIVMGDIPGWIDGSLSDRFNEFCRKDNVSCIPDKPSKAVSLIVKKYGRDISVVESNGKEARSVLVNHRVEAAAHLLFLANTDSTTPRNITIKVKALGGAVELDLLTGRAYRYDSRIEKGFTFISTTLSPSGSRIFLVDQTQTSVECEVPEFDEEALTIEGPYSFQRMHDNTFILDRCSLAIDGKSVLVNEPLWKAKKAIWNTTGIDEYTGFQPWVLEEKNVRTRTNKTVLTFAFTVKDIPERIDLAMESADRFTVDVNGTVVEPVPGKWHIDKRFSAFNLEDHIVEGTNTITATTDFLWDTEIEDIYIFGDFAVGTEKEGFPVINEQATLNTGNWVEQGYPFYSGSIKYKMEFELPEDESARYEIDLSGAKSSNIYVTVNEAEIGAVPFPPFRADITGALKEGLNTVEVEVIGSLRNTLGPLHHKEGDNLDWTGPEQFCDEANWTDTYQFAPYGFLEQPKLVKITEKQ